MGSSRLTSRKPRRVSRGSLHRSGLSARVAKSSNPILRGRLEVRRGAGVIEYPTVDQFRQIAREEGIPAADVEAAFGHTRRQLRRNGGKRIIRPGLLQADETLKGEPSSLIARELPIPPDEIERFGFDTGVYLDIDGETRLLRPDDAMRRVRRWFSPGQFKQAFGHVMTGGLGGSSPEQRKLPTIYGPRSMRLGHWTATHELKTGVGRRSLVLFHKPSGAVIWQAIDAAEANPDKPIVIKFGAKVRSLDFGKALSGAQEHNIPPLAFLQSFDYLLTTESRREAYRSFMPR